MAKEKTTPALSKSELDDALKELLGDDGKPPNIRQKLALIRRTIPNIEKLGHNKAQNYDFMRAEDVCGEIGDAFSHLNLTLVPDEVIYEHVGFREVERSNGSRGTDCDVVLSVKYWLMDGDSDEKIRVSGGGQGRDSGDKAVPKALTCALKYAITQALTMRVGEDSEADETTDAPVHRPEPKSVSTDTPARTNTAPVVPGPAPTRAAGGAVISDKQSRRLYAIAQGNKFVLAAVLKKFGYEDSRKIITTDYDRICQEAERIVKMGVEDRPQTAPDDEDIPF